MEHIFILFFATYSAAFMGVVPPGLINMTAAKTSAKKGKANAVLFAFGASSVVVLQAYLGVMISRYLYNNPIVIDILLKVALIVFAVFAVYFFIIARRKKEKKINVVEVSRKNSFFKGMFLATLNVLPIPYFSGLNAAWNVSGWIKFELLDTLTFILAAGLGTFSTLYIYIIYFSRLESKTDRFSKYSDYILSVLMLILVIITLIRIFYG
ncbi:LysE family transporter [Leptobacterium flavescens]|uniref:LysE family transporter n=1 Tax=Leptobacterium flavescens TaxID=472055 RepID=A0A6P0UQ70_9FLAO|nr:LysE family transporter [Leptobacterium flavescens]NER14620.1 LysE family transporter [Leptobacterium flavescens]